MLIGEREGKTAEACVIQPSCTQGLISMSWSNVGRLRASEGLIKCLKTGWHLWKMLLWIKQSSSWEGTILSRTFTENGSLEKRFSGTKGGGGHSLVLLRGDCSLLLWHYKRLKNPVSTLCEESRGDDREGRPEGASSRLHNRKCFLLKTRKEFV